MPPCGKTDEGNVNSVLPLRYEAPCHAPYFLYVTPSAPAFGKPIYFTYTTHCYPVFSELFLLGSASGAVYPFARFLKKNKQKGCTILPLCGKTDEGNAKLRITPTLRGALSRPLLPLRNFECPRLRLLRILTTLFIPRYCGCFFGYVEDRGSAPVCAFIMQKAFTLPILYCFYGRAASCLLRASRLP